jgi:phosphatidate cytidylyltransferase
MKQRIITGAVLLVLTVLALRIYYTPLFNVISIIIFLISLHEIKGVFSIKTPALLFFGLAVLGVYALMHNSLPKVGLYVFCTALVTLYAFVSVFFFESMDFKNVSSSLMFSLYVLFGFYSLNEIKYILPQETFGYDGLFLVIVCLFIAWGADVMAYFSGYFFGKRKMSPLLSPKKTIEGAIGGFVGAVIVSCILLYAYSHFKPILEGGTQEYILNAKIIIVTAIITIIGVAIEMTGDLFRSAVKRQTGVKDYGSILPGHGGVIDRFDSVILLAPYFLIIACLIAKNGGMYFA